MTALLETPVAHPLTGCRRSELPDDQGVWGRVRGHLHLSGSARPRPQRDRPNPVALRDDKLAPMLEQHGVQISGRGPQAPFVSLILGLLPLVLFFGVFLWLGRRTGRQLAAGLGGIGKARAKVYDAEKPSTRFSD